MKESEIETMMYQGEGKMKLEEKLYGFNNKLYRAQHICYCKEIINFHKEYGREIKSFDDYGCKICDGHDENCIKYQAYIPSTRLK